MYAYITYIRQTHRTYILLLFIRKNFKVSATSERTFCERKCSQKGASCFQDRQGVRRSEKHAVFAVQHAAQRTLHAREESLQKQRKLFWRHSLHFAGRGCTSFQSPCFKGARCKKGLCRYSHCVLARQKCLAFAYICNVHTSFNFTRFWIMPFFPK